MDELSSYQDDNLTRVKFLLERFNSTIKGQEPKPRRQGVSVIILNLDKPDFIIPLMDQLLKERKKFSENGIFFEVLIGDTGSKDARVLEGYSRPSGENFFKIIRNLSYHFSRNNNELALQHAEGTHLLFLNNDIQLDKEACSVYKLYEAAIAFDDKAVIGAYLKYADGTIQHAGVYLSKEQGRRNFPYHAGRGDNIPRVLLNNNKEVPAVTGACLFISSGLFFRAGQFQERYQRECQDISLCLSAHRLGAKIRVIDAGEIIHFENGTRPANDFSSYDRGLFLRTWSSYIEAKQL